MDDDLRVVDAPDTPDTAAPVPEDAPGAVDEPAHPDAGAVPVRRRRVWLRRVGVALVLLLAAVAVGFQVQVTKVRDQAEQAEQAQRLAELDEEAAGFRLESVGARVDVARTAESDAQGVLARSRSAMSDQGLEEARLHDVQVARAADVKDLRAQIRAVAKIVAEQNRLQPAAGACLFDLLRALGEASSSKRSEACTTVDGAG